MPADASTPLRFGVMCHARGLTQFALTCIQNISDLATPQLLILDTAEPRRNSAAEKFKKAIALNGNLWHLQNRLFPVHDIPAYRANPLDDCFPNVVRLCCPVTRKGKWSEYFSQEDIGRIKEHRLDFILKFAYGIIRGDIFSAARFGVWSYHHDDEKKYRGGPPGFWEILKGDPVTGALLQRINTTLDGGVVLKKVYVPTVGTSYAANLQRIQESSTHMVRWVCVDIVRGKAGYLEAPPSKSQAPIYRAPNDFEMLRFYWRLVGNWVRYKLANQRVDEWNIGLVRAAPEDFLKESFEPRIEWSPYREKDQMLADPSLVPSTDGVRILCEELSWFSESGRILEISQGPDGSLSRGVPAIDEPVHMSYPYVLEHGGEIYCVPECCERREVALYRWDQSTKRWARDSVLLEGIPAVDATIFQAYGAWWLLHSEAESFGPWSLYVWTADDLHGPWRPHPANPVKTDVSNSRPAGKPFWHQGKLFRPVQDGRNSYGGALAINRIDCLSMDEYREVTVRRIAPNPSWPYPDGIHTLNGLDGLSVIDAKRHTWPTELIFRRLWYRRWGKPRPRVFRYTSGGFKLDPEV
jgi:hypothetical protein